MLLVLTGADVLKEKLGALISHLMPEDFGAPKGHRTYQPLLVSDRVRYVGDRVAFVVAETQVQARDAAELIEVEYEPLPAVVNIEDGRQARRRQGLGRQCRRQQRLPADVRQRRGRPTPLSAKAKHVVKLRVENNRLSPVAMEPRVAIGDFNAATDETTLYAASQYPHGARQEISHVFHIPRTPCAWCRPTSAAASASRAASSPTTRWWSGRRANSAGR